MNTFPRLYDPSVRRFAWPVAMLMLVGWTGLLALGRPVPIWLEGLAAANLYVTANCRVASDISGAVRHRAATLAAQWFFGVLIAVWFTFKIVAESEFTFHARGLLLMVLGFSAVCEAAYAYFCREASGKRWLVGMVPALLVLAVVLLSY